MPDVSCFQNFHQTFLRSFKRVNIFPIKTKRHLHVILVERAHFESEIRTILNNISRLLSGGLNLFLSNYLSPY